jgi:hypothetical protein
VDFVFTRTRLKTFAENGCGDHTFYISVLDAAGNPLNGVTVEIFWDGGALRVISGSKGPGKADQPITGGHFKLRVVEDAGAGRPVTSERSRLMRTGDWPEAEWEEVRQAGYAINHRFYCHSHYSWDVEIRRTW